MPKSFTTREVIERRMQYCADEVAKTESQWHCEQVGQRLKAGRNHFPRKRHYEGTGSKKTTKVKQCRVCYVRGLHTAAGKPVTITCMGVQRLPIGTRVVR